MYCNLDLEDKMESLECKPRIRIGKCTENLNLEDTIVSIECKPTIRLLDW